jgi:betaine-aldehyde dehydrogenase
VCSNGTRVFVARGIKDAFLGRVVERLEGVVMGDPLDETTNFGPMVSERQREIVEGFIRRGVEEGARLIAGGRRPNRPGFWIEPTVFAEVTDDMAIARDEIFGPVMSVLDFDTEEEVLARANATEFGLAAGVFTRDLQRGHRMAAGFEAGTCFINAYNLTPVEAPFGGMKRSGIGRENGRAAIEHYSQLKSVYVGMGPAWAPF